MSKRTSKGWHRKTGPDNISDRIESAIKPVDRPQSPPELGSGVIAPGVSRYQRLSAHLPSGVTRFQGLGVLPADVAVDLTSEEPTLELRG
jgi:hypothetical protein